MTLVVDSARLTRGKTGILVRAVGPDGTWGAYDISSLTRRSVLEWLQGKTPSFVEKVVLELLDHPRESSES